MHYSLKIFVYVISIENLSYSPNFVLQLWINKTYMWNSDSRIKHLKSLLEPIYVYQYLKVL